MVRRKPGYGPPPPTESSNSWLTTTIRFVVVVLAFLNVGKMLVVGPYTFEEEAAQEKMSAAAKAAARANRRECLANAATQQNTEPQTSSSESFPTSTHEAVNMAANAIAKAIAKQKQSSATANNDSPVMDSLVTRRLFDNIVPHLSAPTTPWMHGHWIFVAEEEHGQDKIIAAATKWSSRRSVESNALAGISVDMIVLDAFWWSPSDTFVPHPQHYPDLTSMLSALDGVGSDLTSTSVRLGLWVSPLIPITSRSDYAHCHANGYFLHDGSDSKKPLTFIWKRGNAADIDVHFGEKQPTSGMVDGEEGAPSQGDDGLFERTPLGDDGLFERTPLHGSLLDLTNPDAVGWLTGRLRPLLMQHAGISAFRLGGVDSALVGNMGVISHRGHITQDEYSRLYTSTFLDIGRKLAQERADAGQGIDHGGAQDFTVVTRAVDSVGRFMYREWSDADADAVPTFMGEHHFTFSSMRESLMDVLHSGGRGYTAVGSVIGGTLPEEGDAPQNQQASSPCGRLLRAPRLLAAQREFVREYEQQSQSADDGDESKIDSVSAYVASFLARPDSNQERNPLMLAAESCGPQRRARLLLRWAQLGASLPVMFTGGLTRTRFQPWRYGPTVERAYSALVSMHSSLGLYFASETAKAHWAKTVAKLATRKLEDTHGLKVVPDEDLIGAQKESPQLVAESRIMDTPPMVKSLSRVVVTFDDPVGEWEFLVGQHLLLSPLVHLYTDSDSVSGQGLDEEDVIFPVCSLSTIPQQSRTQTVTDSTLVETHTVQGAGAWSHWSHNMGTRLDQHKHIIQSHRRFHVVYRRIRPQDFLMFRCNGAIIPLMVPISTPHSNKHAEKLIVLYTIEHPLVHPSKAVVERFPSVVLPPQAGSRSSLCESMSIHSPTQGNVDFTCVPRRSKTTFDAEESAPFVGTVMGVSMLLKRKSHQQNDQASPQCSCTGQSPLSCQELSPLADARRQLSHHHNTALSFVDSQHFNDASNGDVKKKIFSCGWITPETNDGSAQDELLAKKTHGRTNNSDTSNIVLQLLWRGGEDSGRDEATHCTCIA